VQNGQHSERTPKKKKNKKGKGKGKGDVKE
jgi:hypothetical protein